MELKEELKSVRQTLVDIANGLDEDSPIYNYFMNGLNFIDEATRIENGEARLNRKWLHYYADRCS